MMRGMTDSALETTAPPASPIDPAPAEAAPATTSVIDATPIDPPPAPEPTEPTEPELTDEEKKLHEFYTALDAWRNRFDKDWKYDRYEFHGDLLAVRIPKQGALLAVSMAGAKYGSDDQGLSAMNQFCNLHLGPESRKRVFDRMMDPEEIAYGDSPMGDLFTALGKLEPEPEPK